MKNKCSGCCLKVLIEDKQDKLNKLIIEKNYNLQDDKVITLSEEIDKLLVNCTICKKNNDYRYILLNKGQEICDDNKFIAPIRLDKVTHK